MIFFEQYLITLTFIVISVWVRPAATEPDLTELTKLCEELLNTSIAINDPNSPDNDKYDEPLKTVLDKITATVKEEWLNDLAAKIDTNIRRSYVVKNALSGFELFTKNDTLMNEVISDYYTTYEEAQKKPKTNEEPVVSFCKVGITPTKYKEFLTLIFNINKQIDETRLPV